MSYHFLLEAPQVEISAVSQQFGTMVFILDMQRVAAKQMQELSEDLGGS